ncbi:MAG TPA: MarR family transcriptional regulator [Ilumatobacter sp.]|nr:MarR family transcriptional regulator [Ilumatobacter sp.]
MVTFIPAAPLPDAVEWAVDLLHRVNREIRRAALANQPAGAPSPAEARALRALGRAEHGMRMSALADGLGIVRRSATSVVEQLVASGLVERVPDPTDGRAVVVALTPAGTAELERVGRRRVEAGAVVLSRLTEPELATLTRLLSTLADGASEARPGT